MISQNRITTHSGTILLKEYLEPLNLTQKELVDHLEIPIQRINEIVRGKRGTSSDTSWLLSKALNTSPEFWLNLQAMYDLSSNRPSKEIAPLKAVQALPAFRFACIK
jgi:addiction module HigA family antidote